MASAEHPESPLIQFRLAIITSAIPSSAPATPNPGDPWDEGWSVDEESAAVLVGARNMKATCCAGMNANSPQSTRRSQRQYCVDFAFFASFAVHNMI